MKRSVLARGVLSALFAAPLLPAPAPAVDAAARVTSQATLRIAVGAGEEARPLVVGLYGDDAPASVKVFRGMCDGSLVGPEMTYRGSVVSRVERDRAFVMGRPPSGAAQALDRSIDSTGYVRSKLVNLAEAFANDDRNDLKHDRAGVVSMLRGGGEFDFVVAPAANPQLDGSNVVIGQVLNLDEAQGAALIDEINTVPVRQPKPETALFGAVAKAGGDPRARIESVNKPLRKIQILGCEWR